MPTPFEYNEKIYNDLRRYGSILTDLHFEELNVRVMNIKDRSGNIWFVRIQQGSVYDCFNLNDYNGLKQAFYKIQNDEERRKK